MKNVDVKCDKCGQLAYMVLVNVTCIRGNCRGVMRPVISEKADGSKVPCSDRVIKPDGEWISVEITKPVESGEYLVYWDGIKIGGDRVPGVACYQVAYWREEMVKFVDPDGRKKWRTPDYWMRLPKPPKAL